MAEVGGSRWSEDLQVRPEHLKLTQWRRRQRGRLNRQWASDGLRCRPSLRGDGRVTGIRLLREATGRPLVGERLALRCRRCRERIDSHRMGLPGGAAPAGQRPMKMGCMGAMEDISGRLVQAEEELRGVRQWFSSKRVTVGLWTGGGDGSMRVAGGDVRPEE